MPADIGVDRVDAQILRGACQEGDLIPRLAVLHEVGDRLAQDDREVGGNLLAHGLDDFDEEALTILRRAAPVVGAVVGVRAEELVDQVTFAAHEFDRVISSPVGELRRLAEGLDDMPDDGFGHLEVLERVNRRGLGSRRDLQRRVAVASGVDELDRDRPAGLVHGLGEPAVTPNVHTVGDLAGERQELAGPGGGEAAGDDEAGAAACSLGVVRGEFVGVPHAVFEAGVHGPHDDAVGQGEAVDPQRFE